MRILYAGILLLGAVAGSAHAEHQASQARALAPRTAPRLVAVAAPRALRERPPAPYIQADSADSLYREARRALNGNRYRDAVELFRSIRSRYPRSGYVPDSFYWEAFALYRIGGIDELRSARQALRTQARDYPRAATAGDARALLARVQGELARLGDEEAAADVAEAAAAAAVEPADPAEPAEPAAAPGAPRAAGAEVREAERARRAARVSSRRAECPDDEDDTKTAALNALLQMDSERAVPILRKLLARRDESSACLRRRAVFLLSQKQTGDTEETLLDVARNDPDPEVQEQAVFWLSQVGTERAVAALDSILRSASHRGLQDKAIFALSQHRSPRASAALRGFAEREDVDPEIREKAIFWLGQSGGAENAAFLRTMYPKVRSEELKKKIVFSLSQMGGAENQAWMMSIVRNRSEPVEARKNALFWAGQSGRLSAADLNGLYSSLDSREMKEQVIFVLSQQDSEAAVDELLKIAKTDGDPELRKKALFWLGQSDDPRAADAIEEILNQ